LYIILRLRVCPGLPFGGRPNREEMALPPSLPPSQPSRSSSCPCHHDSCTLNNEATTCTHWPAGTYRHAHMHKLTRALECATASACPHASACAHARMLYTHANTHQHTHSLTLTHIHKQKNTSKQALYMRARAHTNTNTNTHVQALDKLPTGVGAGIAKILLERVWDCPRLL